MILVNDTCLKELLVKHLAFFNVVTILRSFVGFKFQPLYSWGTDTDTHWIVQSGARKTCPPSRRPTWA